MPHSNAKMLTAGNTTAIQQIYMQDIIVVTRDILQPIFPNTVI
jgi:hypothetical protein